MGMTVEMCNHSGGIVACMRALRHSIHMLLLLFFLYLVHKWFISFLCLFVLKVILNSHTL